MLWMIDHQRFLPLVMPLIQGAMPVEMPVE